VRVEGGPLGAHGDPVLVVAVQSDLEQDPLRDQEAQRGVAELHLAAVGPQDQFLPEGHGLPADPHLLECHRGRAGLIHTDHDKMYSDFMRRIIIQTQGEPQ